MAIMCFGQTYAQFHINADPQDPTRQPDPKTEAGIILQKNSPTITVGSGSGKKTKNYLPSGVLVIVDKNSGLAKWVAACGNTIVTIWKPRGKEIFFKETGSYEGACVNMLKALENKVDDIKKGVNELLSRPSLTLLEMRTVFQEELNKKFPFTSPGPSNNSSHEWTTGKTVTTILAMGAGFAGGGYGFQKTEEGFHTIVVPGIGVQTDDGTMIYGPDHLKVETYTTQSFNWGMATVCGLASGLITLLLNYLVF